MSIYRTQIFHVIKVAGLASVVVINFNFDKIKDRVQYNMHTGAQNSGQMSVVYQGINFLTTHVKACCLQRCPALSKV